tara:strand:- start:40 stop:312 length:273 start_codon:yes stop_codon:yes gene_type:complete
MSIFGIAKKGFGMLGKSKKVSPTIKSVKPIANKDSAHKINLAKIPGRVQKIHAPMLESSNKTLAAYRQINQKFSGEKKTKSGISKGKDKK